MTPTGREEQRHLGAGLPGAAGQGTRLRARLANALFGDVIQAAAREAAAAVSVRVDDSPGWATAGGGPHDRDFAEWYQDQTDALEAWRKNFLVRRIVTLTRSYVLGGGIEISSDHPWVQSFVAAFLAHPKNRLPQRYGALCDELIRAGEVYPLLFTNAADGMSYCRFVPASQIIEITTDPDDYETELLYHSPPSWGGAGGGGDKAFFSSSHPEAWSPGPTGHLSPLMLHWHVNRPIGATRGEGDLTPILKWALRYSNWLEDRVRLNRVRTRQQLLEIQLADDTQVQARKRQVETEDPVRAGIYVHGPGETVVAHKLEIGADDASADGKALRLAVASGANTALHYMGEGESANYATAKEMGEPTARFYTERQQQLVTMLLDLVETAYRRKAALGLARLPADGNLRLRAAVTEAARADNRGLAEAAQLVTQALQVMHAEGWIDDLTAATLAFKFAGEAMPYPRIREILDNARQEGPPPPVGADACPAGFSGGSPPDTQHETRTTEEN